MNFSQKKCTGYETLLNIYKTRESKHHITYIFRFLRKDGNEKIKNKFQGITISTVAKAKNFKTVAKVVEKKAKNWEMAQKKRHHTF